MLDVVAAVEPPGGTRISRPLYQIFGTDLGVAIPAQDGFGVDDGVADPVVRDTHASGYWWARISVAFVLLAVVLTLVSMRLVVPTGMRWAFRRRDAGAGCQRPVDRRGARCRERACRRGCGPCQAGCRCAGSAAGPSPATVVASRGAQRHRGAGRGDRGRGAGPARRSRRPLRSGAVGAGRRRSPWRWWDGQPSSLRQRPSLVEAARRADEELELRQRLGTALELARHESADPLEARQLADARARLHAVDLRRAFRPRLARRPLAIAGGGLAMTLLLVAWPNPQDAVIDQQRAAREASERVAERVEDIADEIGEENVDNPDPRREELERQLRELARQLREQGADREATLARIGSVQEALSRMTDPRAAEQDAGLSQLARSASRAATGDEEAEPGRRSRAGGPRPGGAGGACRDPVRGRSRGARGRPPTGGAGWSERAAAGGPGARRGGGCAGRGRPVGVRGGSACGGGSPRAGGGGHAWGGARPPAAARRGPCAVGAPGGSAAGRARRATDRGGGPAGSVRPAGRIGTAGGPAWCIGPARRIGTAGRIGTAWRPARFVRPTGRPARRVGPTRGSAWRSARRPTGRPARAASRGSARLAARPGRPARVRRRHERAAHPGRRTADRRLRRADAGQPGLRGRRRPGRPVGSRPHRPTRRSGFRGRQRRKRWNRSDRAAAQGLASTTTPSCRIDPCSTCSTTTPRHPSTGSRCRSR